MPATIVWSAPTPPYSAPPPSTVDAARFDALVAQVARLTTLLAEQTAANVALQKTLEAALSCLAAAVANAEVTVPQCRCYGGCFIDSGWGRCQDGF